MTHVAFFLEYSVSFGIAGRARWPAVWTEPEGGLIVLAGRVNWSKAFRVSLVSMAVAGFVFVCLESPAPGITYTFGVRLKVVVVKASEDAEPGMDATLSKGLQKVLAKEFKREFKSFTKLSENVDAQRFSQPRTWPLPNGSSMIMTAISHKKSQINMKIEYDYRVMLPTMWHRKHWVRKMSTGKDTYIVCVWPELRQAEREK